MSEASPRSESSIMAMLGILMGFWGYLDAVNTAAAPHLAREFAIGDRAIAIAFGWTAVGALASLPIARAADRIGRRRVLLGSAAALAPLSLASALAPSLAAFVGCQMLVQALKGVLFTLTPVMVAEAVTTARRARGQAVIGAAGTVGAGLALGLVAACAALPGDWRWAWGAAALFALALPFARGRLAESRRFERAEAAGETRDSTARELFAPALRTRTAATLAIGVLQPFATTGAQLWIIYHPVRNLGLEPWVATLVVIAGGAFSLVGYAFGGRLCESWGRRGTFVAASVGFVGATLGFYRVPADLEPHPGLGLGLCFAGMAAAAAMGLVPMRAAATELFPTRLRGAISGALAISAAVAVVAVNFSVALLVTPLGGIAPAASFVSTALLVAAGVFLVAVPETRGLDLE
ncbi:MAG: MFS transporter [Myxococcota bacterium]|nr:MFS transporter [Myxococcota bacterium]